MSSGLGDIAAGAWQRHGLLPRLSIPRGFQKGKDFGQELAFGLGLHFRAEAMAGSIHDDQPMKDSGLLKFLRQLLRLLQRNPLIIPPMEEQHGSVVGGHIGDRGRRGCTALKGDRVLTQEKAGGIMSHAVSGFGEAIEVGGAVEVDDRSDSGGQPFLIKRVGNGAEQRSQVAPEDCPRATIRSGSSEFSGISSHPPHGLAEVIECPWPTGRAGPSETIIDRDDNVAGPCQARDHRVSSIGPE